MIYFVSVLCVLISPVITEDGNGTLIRSSRQTRLCVLPPYPENGIYEVSNEENAYPGQAFNSLVLTVKCRRGYGVLENSNGTSSADVYCINGRWAQKMPKCVRFCRLDLDPSVRYMCHVPGTTGFKVCDLYVAPGTSVSPLCNTPIYYSAESLLYMKCMDGDWDYVAKCKVECGRLTPEGDQLIIDGKKTKRGEIPWHVGIYRKVYRPYKQICGGSLISNEVVISAAHCFWHDVKKLLPSSEFATAIGKLYRPWNSEKDIGAQKSDVKQIMVPHLFEGESANFQEDIALVVLESPFTYKAYIRPVCLNFDSNFDSWQLRKGNLGKVAGWGLTEANGKESKFLKAVQLPFVDVNTCISAIPPVFREYITGDKFCAGYTNGTALCKGDSGGGLAFPDKELGIDRYYLRGIVSAAPKNDEKTCNDEVYAAFTKITKHEEFIKRSVAASKKKTCTSLQFKCADGNCVDIDAECNGVSDCTDGSDESDDNCIAQSSTIKPKNFTEACILPPYPKHGTYKVATVPEAKPGQVFDSFVLTVICDEGYGLPVDGLASKGAENIDMKSQQVYCVNGAWYQKVVNCIRFCPVEPDDSVRFVSCKIPGTQGFRTCPDYVPPGTSVIPACNTPNYQSDDALDIMKCVNGNWNYNAECQAECGRVTPQGDVLVIGGQNAKRGELPWHVGVYKKTMDPYRQVCSGSIVSNNLVISAGHCFYSDTKKEPAENFAVAAGKLYRDWDDENDIDVQTSDIKEINTPSRYQGENTLYQGDISVLVLAKPFQYKPYIRPVCINFDKKVEKIQLQNRLGKVAGWGLTSANGEPSPVLKVAEMPYVNVETCLKDNPKFAPYITLDKFCAGYTNGTASLCRGDTGGGLVFPNKNSNEDIERYFLRGIVSIAPNSEDLCNPYTFIGFTKITRHEEFITEYIIPHVIH